MASTSRPTMRLDPLTFEFYADNTILTKDKRYSYLTVDATAGQTSLTIQNNLALSGLTNVFLQIGETGASQTEIIRLPQTQPSSVTSLNLPAAGIQFNHSQDTKVFVVNYDQFAFSRSTGISSQKSTIVAASNLMPNLLETIGRDTTNTTGYAFLEFYNSAAAVYSKASDPVPYTGYDDDTVFEIKRRALESCNEKIDAELITHDFLNNALYEGRREYHHSPGKRPFRKIFNFSAGTVTAGQYRVPVPTDLEAPYSAENLYGVRIGIQPNMSYYDKKQWDQDLQGVAHTTITNTAGYTVGDKDLYLSDVRELAASGSVNLENDTIAYSAIGISGGTLRISTQGTSNHANGIDVWQGVTFGLPSQFTVFNDTAPPEFSFTNSVFIYFNVPINNTYVNQDIYLDYYSKVIAADSDNDVLDEPDFDMFVYYLAWRIKKRKNRGMIDAQDPDYLLWQQRKAQALQKEWLGSEIRLSPDVSSNPISADNRSLW